MERRHRYQLIYSRSNGDVETDISEANSSAMELEAPYRTSENILVAFIITLCANRGIDWTRADQDPQIQEEAMAWLSQVLGSRFKHSTLSLRIKRLLNAIDENCFQSSVTPLCSWRRFFVTRSSHMGIGPASMRRGDTIAVLFGSTMPFVLRPVDGTPGRYKLIGECYLQGIVDGELLERWKEHANSPADVFQLK